MTNYIDLTGKRFGKLTVIKLDHKEQRYYKNKKSGFYYYWLCKCDCGNYKVINREKLNSGNTKSCGCLHKEIMTIHGLSNSRLYRIYNKMKNRCYNTKNNYYHRYGARGITICNEWLKDKNKFFEWALNNGYKDDLTIDRIDNNKGYSPDNCRWTTIKEQSRNTCRVKKITYNGETHCISEWTEILGFSRTLISNRLDRGWSVERALSTY